MADATTVFATSTGTFRPRAWQIIAALPAFLVWSILSGMAAVWLGAVAFQAVSGNLIISGDWRWPYLLFMTHLVLFFGALTAVSWWRAFKGRSALWWHGGTFLGGVVFVILLGIVGD